MKRLINFSIPALALVLAVCIGSPIRADLIHHFPLDSIDSSGTPSTTPNLAGTPDGSLTDSPAPSLDGSGAIGSSFDFAGSNSEYVEVPDPFFGVTETTLSFWVRRDNAGAGDGFVSNWESGSSRSILTRTNGPEIQTYIWTADDDQEGGNTGLTINDTTEFHHVAVTYDNSKFRTYLDGVEGTDRNAAGAIGATSPGRVTIGGGGGSERAMDGLIDDVAVFDEPLSQTQIQVLGDVARDPGLNYHAGNAQALFDVFAEEQPDATIGSLTWTKAADRSIAGLPGEVLTLPNGNRAVVLNDNGGGVVTGSGAGLPEYRIDIDSTDGDGGPIETADGWYSLDATGTTDAATLNLGGIVFSPFTADGSAIVRTTGGNPDPDPLLADFAFDDGVNQAVGLLLGGAGDLEAGTWEVDMWIWDAANPMLGDQIVRYREGGAEKHVATVSPSATGPAITFQFVSDGVSAYDVFVREANASDRAVLNALVLRRVPEPTGLVLLVLGVLPLLVRRRSNRA